MAARGEGAEGEIRSQCFMGFRVSVWEDKKAKEMDGGDTSCTTI